jgi:hypothetical protein
LRLHGILDDVELVEADLRDPETILTNPGLRELIDFTEPVAVLLIAILRRGAQLGDHGRGMMIAACRSPDSERPHKIMSRCLSDHGPVRP